LSKQILRRFGGRSDVSVWWADVSVPTDKCQHFDSRQCTLAAKNVVSGKREDVIKMQELIGIIEDVPPEKLLK
jgi:hypothetical protein